MSPEDRIKDLEVELEKKDAELLKLYEQLREFEDARKAMLYMLEDLNESAASLEKAKRHWEATFDAISDPLFIHDKELKIIRANRAYSEAAGLSFEEIIDRLYYEVFPKMKDPFRGCGKALELQEEEEVYIPSIDKIYKIKFFPVKDVEGNYIYSVHLLEDITEIKKAEENLKEEMGITSHLLMITKATSDTTDIDRLMGQVVHCVSSITASEVCLSYLWNSEDGVFRPCQSYGLTHEMIPLFLTTPLGEELEDVKKTLESKEPVIIQIADSSESEVRSYELSSLFSRLPWIKGFNSMYLIALVGMTGNLGILICLCRKVRTFSERDRKVAGGISQAVSLALEEAQLYKDSIEKAMELANKIETIQVMQEIDRSILSTLDPEVILESAVINISRVIPCDRSTVALVDKGREAFTYASGFGVSSIPKGTTVPFKDTSATDVVKTGRPQYVPNIKSLKNILPLEKRLLEEGFLSHMRVPLTVKGEIIGVLSAGSKRPASFITEDLSTLEKIALQISVALENARLVKDLQELFLGTVKSLSSAIDAKSRWTAGHSERVTSYALGIAQEMGLSEKEMKDLELAGLLHDIGKIGTYESILDKPAKLTEEELRIIKEHPVKGAEILMPIKQLMNIIPPIKHHHEFYDGTGYPEGLRGEEIPFHARILAVADTFDAMKADRPYRKGKTEEFIKEELKRCSGTQFDPKVVKAFQSLLGRT